jgi:hypothetical protein
MLSGLIFSSLFIFSIENLAERKDFHSEPAYLMAAMRPSTTTDKPQPQPSIQTTPPVEEGPDSQAPTCYEICDCVCDTPPYGGGGVHNRLVGNPTCSDLEGQECTGANDRDGQYQRCGKRVPTKWERFWWNLWGYPLCSAPTSTSVAPDAQ